MNEKLIVCKAFRKLVEETEKANMWVQDMAENQGFPLFAGH